MGGWRGRESGRVVRWEDEKGERLVRREGGEGGKVVRWQGGKGGKMVRQKGGRYLVLFKGGGHKMSPSFIFLFLMLIKGTKAWPQG